MSVTAAQAEADFTAALANITTLATNAVALLNQLAAQNSTQAGVDPAFLESGVASINALAQTIGVAVAADTPPSSQSASAQAGK